MSYKLKNQDSQLVVPGVGTITASSEVDDKLYRYLVNKNESFADMFVAIDTEAATQPKAKKDKEEKPA